MSKKIHTIQSSDKNEFDKKVNNLLGIGCELLENTYEVIKNNDGVIYSQVIEFDTINTYITFYNDGQLDLMGMLDKDGKRVGLYTSWYENGQKEREENYKDGELDGLFTRWDQNGQKRTKQTYKDGKIDGLWTRWYSNGQKEIEGTLKDGEHDGLLTYWDQNGQKRKEETYKDGELDKLVTKWWNKDGSVDQFGQSGDSLRFDALI